MGTNNFALKGSVSGYYTVLNSYKDEETGEMIQPDDLDYECLTESLIDSASEVFQNSWADDSYVKSYGYDSYGSRYVFSVAEDVWSGNFGFRIGLKCFITAGYYDGATLDYHVFIDGEQIDYPDPYAVEEAIEYALSYHDLNAGLKRIHTNRLRDIAEERLDRLTADMEKIFAKECEVKLAKIGQFSNGEAVYRAV